MNESVSNIRLRAYERLTLVLERMVPEKMVSELELSTMSTSDLAQALLTKLRAEVDYNLSQQIYVSDELWEQILFSRDQMASFILTIQSQLPEDANALYYAQALIKAYRNNGLTPQQKALETLKKEVREMF